MEGPVNEDPGLIQGNELIECPVWVFQRLPAVVMYLNVLSENHHLGGQVNSCSTCAKLTFGSRYGNKHAGI